MAEYVAAFPESDYEIFEVPGLGRFWLDDNPAFVKQKLRTGQPYSPHLIEQFEKHVVPGTTVLDVGAHIGSLTVPLARLVGPEGRVYAFEPQKKVFRELVYNLRLNDLDNAVPLRFALSSAPGIIEMDPIRSHDGQVSIGRGGDAAEARTLDSFAFDDVSLIKIDVEGHEQHVLEGAGETLAAFHPVLVIEILPRYGDTLIPFIQGIGYTLEQVDHHDYVATYSGG